MPQAIVTNHTELALAVANMDIDEIIFGANIVMESAINIPAGRDSLIFDGTLGGVQYSLTDLPSDLPTQTLGLQSGSSIQITMRNIELVGNNYYGIPYIIGVGTSNVRVEYINVTYTGPQMAYNIMGTTYIEGCDITIAESDYSPSQEVGQVNRVIINGQNTINHTDDDDAVFWFRGSLPSPSLTMLPGSKLNVVTNSYFMFNTDGLLTTYPVSIDMQAGASLDILSDHGFSGSSLCYLTTFYVREGASFRYIQQRPNATAASLYINNGLHVLEGASFYMQADFDDCEPLICLSDGTAMGPNIVSPKSFVLYCRDSQPIEKTIIGSRPYSITAAQLNHWTQATDFPDAGTFLDEPQNKWNNTNWADFTMSGMISYNSNTATVSGLNPPYPTPSLFNFIAARVISAGNISLTPDPAVDNGRAITGTTEPYAFIKISFTVDGQTFIFDSEQAGPDGRFSCDPLMEIPIGTVIDFQVNTPFLIQSAQTQVVAAGEITISSAPVKISFMPPPVIMSPLMLPRVDFDAPVVISDDRVYLTDWRLSASITGPLTTAAGDVLANAVVFRDSGGTIRALGETPILVREGEGYFGDTNVDWPIDQGVLVRPGGPIRSGAEYTTGLVWSLDVDDERHTR